MEAFVIKNLLGEYELKNSHYTCYLVSRNTAMAIDADILSEGETIEKVTMYPFFMKEFSMLVEQRKNGKYVDSMEFVCGINATSVKKAYYLVSSRRVSLMHIEDVLHANNLPYVQGFKDCAMSAVKGYVRNNKKHLMEHIHKKDSITVSMRRCTVIPAEHSRTEVAAGSAQ